MKLAVNLLAALAAVSTVAAHSTFQEFWVGSQDVAGTCIRTPFNNNPVSSATSADMACNVGQNTSGSAGLCTLQAGGTATVEMHAQPGDRACGNLAIGGNHDGPVIVYMAKVDNAMTASGTAAKWFKVAESGLLSKDRWATDALNDNCGKFVFTVPSCIAPGDYLIRAEVIALHVAGQLNGAQFYMSCYTVTVTGGGSTIPTGVSIPGYYSPNDPGIHFDLYGQYTTYTIPGPPVFTCGANSGGGGPPGGAPITSGNPILTTPLPPASTVLIPPISTIVRTPVSTPAPGAPLYGQCGGKEWTGATTCIQGTCTASGEYYSQCLP